MAEKNVSRRAFVTLTGAATAAQASAAGGRQAAVSPAAVSVASPQAQSDTIRVVALYEFEPNEIRTLQNAASPTKVEITMCRDREQFRRQLRNAEVVYGSVQRGEIDLAPSLKWIQWGSAGVNNIPDDLRDSPIVVTNMARIFAPGISETAIGLLLCLTRGIRRYLPMQLNGEIKATGTVKSHDHVELVGRVMGIVGMGGIGSNVARRAHYGFDMRVVATDAKPLPKPEYVAELHDPSWFSEMVPMADVLVAAAPWTPQTDKIFNEAVFRRMKKTAYFLGLSRGALFDPMALVKALKEGWIAGAGLDVFEPDPAPKGHPIYTCDNVVMTPHTSGWSPDRQVRLIAHFAENLRRYAIGAPLQAVVDKVRQY
jgi:phosphoglycerate dehydrogenase-like enzyme